MTRTTDKSLRLRCIAILVLATGALLPGSIRADDSEAWLQYQDFLGACETATSVEELLPFLAEWRLERYEALDEAGRKEMLTRLCRDTETIDDISFDSEEIEGDATTLHLKATWNGLPMKGRVIVVREDDGLKVDEWSWATGE
ncbi:MAG: hypothetical protein MPN21_28060 [Thermoanaerobaculia bacterium]|nr:hypothetical protein [Thermoanaerobaculia bacterium]